MAKDTSAMKASAISGLSIIELKTYYDCIMLNMQEIGNNSRMYDNSIRVDSLEQQKLKFLNESRLRVLNEMEKKIKTLVSDEID